MNFDFPPGVVRFSVPFQSTSVQCYDSDPSGVPQQTIVLLHGSGGSAAGSFWALLPMLARRHRVVTFDFLDPAQPTENEDFFVEQARAVAGAVCRDGQIDLFGYSFGAVIATKLAAANPQLVRSLILVAGWAKTDGHQLLRNNVWQNLHEDGHEALGKFTVFTTYSQHFINSRTMGELDALIETGKQGITRAAKMRVNRSVDLLSELDKIQMPTLVVGCELDQTAPIRHSHILFGGIENARLFEMNAGHGVVHERPAELAAVTGDFVAAPALYPAAAVIPNEHA